MKIERRKKHMGQVFWYRKFNSSISKELLFLSKRNISILEWSIDTVLDVWRDILGLHSAQSYLFLKLPSFYLLKYFTKTAIFYLLYLLRYIDSRNLSSYKFRINLLFSRFTEILSDFRTLFWAFQKNSLLKYSINCLALVFLNKSKEKVNK